MKSLLQRLAHRLGHHIGPYPDDFHRDLLALFARERVNCVLDVGAHRGDYALRLRAVGYTGHIVSFEPSPETFAALARRASGDAKWRVLPYALGSSDAEESINVFASTDFNSFLAPSEFGRHRFPSEVSVRSVERVRVRRLDAVLDECVAGISAPSVFLKIDTQGFDFQVIEGAGARLREMRGLQIELPVQPLYEGVGDFSDAVARLYALGFYVTSLAPIFRTPERRVGEFDCLAEWRDER
jgi:FkbM family methyltransferase